MPKNVEVSAGDLIEGGEFHCYIPGHDDFRTSNIQEWWAHMESKDEDGKPLHVEDGTSECIFCHKANTPFVGIPWTRPGTVKGAICDNCKETQLKALLGETK
jgi:hypothetical protein